MELSRSPWALGTVAGEIAHEQVAGLALCLALGFTASEVADKIAEIRELQQRLSAMPRPATDEEIAWAERWGDLDDGDCSAGGSRAGGHSIERAGASEDHDGQPWDCSDPICIEWFRRFCARSRRDVAASEAFRRGLDRAIAAGLTVERVVMFVAYVIAQESLAPSRRCMFELEILQPERLSTRARESLTSLTGFERSMVPAEADAELDLVESVRLALAIGLSADAIRDRIMSARLAGWGAASDASRANT